MGLSDEEAKAVQAIAKTTEKALNKIEDLERIGGKLLGPFGQGYGILTDLAVQLREEIDWRITNRKAIYRKVYEKALAAGIDLENANTVPPRIAYDYTAALEREDDPTLQDLWANLLLNTTRPDDTIPQKFFQGMLSRMEGDDALFFSMIMEQHTVMSFNVSGDWQGAHSKTGTYITIYTRSPEWPDYMRLDEKFATLKSRENFEILLFWQQGRVMLTINRLINLGVLQKSENPASAGPGDPGGLTNYKLLNPQRPPKGLLPPPLVWYERTLLGETLFEAIRDPAPTP